MKRIYIIGSILSLIVIGVGWFWLSQYPAKEKTNEVEVLPETDIEEENIPREDFSQVLSDRPAKLDFVQLAEEQLMKDRQAEKANMDRRILTPLASLSSFAESMQAGITQGTTEWCPLYLEQQSKYAVDVGDGAAIKLQYQEDVEGERSVRDEIENGGQSEQWNAWLLRLTEAGAAKKKTKKAVESFQDEFNEITDEYDTVLAREREQFFQAVDQVFLAKPERIVWAATLFQNLSQALSEREAICTTSWSLESAMVPTYLKTVTAWRETIEAAQKTTLAQQQSIESYQKHHDPVTRQTLEQLSTQVEEALTKLRGDTD